MIDRHDKKALKKDISLYKVAFFMIICLSSVLFLSSNVKAIILINETFENGLLSNWNITNGKIENTTAYKFTGNNGANITGNLYTILSPYQSIVPLNYANNSLILKSWVYSSFYQFAFNYPSLRLSNTTNATNGFETFLIENQMQIIRWYEGAYDTYTANWSCSITYFSWYLIVMNITKENDRDIITSLIYDNTSSLICSDRLNVSNSNFSNSSLYVGLGNGCLGSCENYYDDVVVEQSGVSPIANITININTPSNNTFTNLPGTFKGINFTYSHPNSTQATCYLYVNGSLNNVKNSVNSSQATIINWTNNRTTGKWEYYIRCDTPTETNNSEKRILYIDLIPPFYSNFTNNATASTPKFNQTASWNITLYDNFNISYYSLWHYSNGSLVLDNATYPSGTNTELNISTIKNITAKKGYNVCGLYVFVDTAGNINFTPASCFLVKNTPPIVILDKPGNNSYLNVNYATFNWSATDIDTNDTNITQHNLWMSEDGGLTYNLKYNGGNPTILLNNLPSGVLYWFASSYDGTNWGNSSIFKLNIGAPVLNITARDYASNASITSFTAVLTAPNGTQIIKSTTSKSIIFNLTYEIWNYTISTSGYTDVSGTISMIDGNKNLTIYMQFPATINVNVYFPNNTLANGILTSLLFISETQAYSVLYTTTTGTKYIPYIPSDSYQLKFNASGYRDGVYYFNINTTTSASIKLNLIANSSSQIFITLYDINGNVLEGYIIKALRFDTNTNNWEFYQMSKTDDNGIATMFFTPFDNYYQFVVEKDGIVYLATTARLVYGDFSLIINPSRIDVLPMLTAGNIAYNLSYDTSGSGFFRFQYNDLNSIVVRGCLRVKNPLSSQYLCTECSDSTSAVLICNLNASNSSVLLAQAVITYLNDDYTIATLEKNFTTDYQTFGAGGIFYVALLVLALSLLALWHPIVAIAMAIIAMLLSGIIGLFYLTFTAGVVLVILGLVYMVLMRK